MARRSSVPRTPEHRSKARFLSEVVLGSSELGDMPHFGPRLERLFRCAPCRLLAFAAYWVCRSPSEGVMLQFDKSRLFASSAFLLGVALLLGACDVGGPKPAQLIAGPAVPSPIPTSPPHVWDTRTELEVWAKNAVTSGQMTVQGIDREAVINFDRPSDSWVLRGPDLEPPAEGILGVRIRYRWEPDPRLGPGSSRTGSMTAHFERVPFAIDQPE